MWGVEMRHGGELAQASCRYGFPEEDWLDLSTGINPQPWPGFAGFGMAQLGLERLPSAAGLDRLLAAARKAYGVPPDLAVAAVPGSEALIRALPSILPGEATLAATSYGSYIEAWGRAGALLEVAGLSEAAAASPERSVILVNPNNPDGSALSPAELLAIARTRRGAACLVVDEAFADAEADLSLVPHLSESAAVLVLKSFGKFFGLPGLRLGFAIGHNALVEAVSARFGDWPVSAPALAVGTEALEDAWWQEEARRWLADQSRRLDMVLGEAGLCISGGTQFFRLVRCPDASRLHERLARQAIWTRVWHDRPELIRFGLPPDDRGLLRLSDALAVALRG